MKHIKIVYVCIVACFFSINARVFNSQIPESLVKRDILQKKASTLLDTWYTHFAASLQTKRFKQFTNEYPIVVIIPSYNNKDWYELNLLSVCAQHYANYKVIYINDCSTDGTGELVANVVHKLGMQDKIHIINNTQRHGALYNLYHAIHTCSNNTIIVTLDGDDWFYDDQVLARINSAYSKSNVLLTYGQMQEFRSYYYDHHSFCKPLPQDIINDKTYRKYTWVTSHLRTFYAGLFKQIKKEDLQNEHGEFWPMTWDQAFMFPMLEMAGERIKFISDVLYVYNMATPTNDNKVNAKLQRVCERKIRSLPKYPTLTQEEIEQCIKEEKA